MKNTGENFFSFWQEQHFQANAMHELEVFCETSLLLGSSLCGETDCSPKTEHSA